MLSLFFNSQKTKFTIMDTIKVVRWPESQICMDCVYGEFVESEKTFTSSDYICHHPSKIRQDQDCPHNKTIKEKTHAHS
jgi:hypothetical protein